MYPEIELFGYTLDMTGVGIVFSIFFFIFLMRFFAKRFGLNFWKFFNWLPLFLVVPYLLGSYTHWVFLSGNFPNIFPTLLDLKYILSPYEYGLNFVGLSLGFFIVLFFFLKKTDLRQEKLKWIDTFFYSFVLTLVPLGMFLTLGDVFIGVPTDGFFSVQSLQDTSKLNDSSGRYPVGFFLSILALFLFTFIWTLHYAYKKYGIGLFGFMLLLLFLNVVFYFQHYSKHLVTLIDGLSFKNYWTFILIILIIVYYFMDIRTNKGK